MQTISFMRGLAQLASDGTLGVTDVVEGMHRDIAGFGAAPDLWRSTLSGFIYDLVRGGMRLSGKTLAVALGAAEHVLAPPGNAIAENLLDDLASALNGAFGDHIEESGNPLAIRMQVRIREGGIEPEPTALAKAFPRPSGRILLFVHGLCLNERCWNQADGVNFGTALADHHGYDCVFLRYNSGRHVSTNGRELAVLLGRMLTAWPVPVDEFSIIGHSMGGLLARSACHYARQDRLNWTQYLRTAVYLGTPHHGSLVEKLGQITTLGLSLAPYARALWLLGKARSAGVKDMRHGNLLDEDWQGGDQDTSIGDRRHPVPLFPGVRHCMAAGTLEQEEEVNPLKGMVGDMLVRVQSAMGDHADVARRLEVPAGQRHVFRGVNHFDLLRHQDVYAQIERWLVGMTDARCCVSKREEFSTGRG